MKIALEVAKKSTKEVPVGALIVNNNQVIASSCNQVMQKKDVTAHAEIIAIQEASNHLNCRILKDCDIYITLEPCPMCAYAICLARIRAIYFGAYDIKMGALSCGHFGKSGYFYLPKVYEGIMQSESSAMLKQFFRNLR